MQSYAFLKFFIRYYPIHRVLVILDLSYFKPVVDLSSSPPSTAFCEKTAISSSVNANDISKKNQSDTVIKKNIATVIIIVYIYNENDHTNKTFEIIVYSNLGLQKKQF